MDESYKTTMDELYKARVLPCISRHFANDHLCPDGLNLYTDLFSTEIFFPLQRQAELKRMMEIARTISPKVIYEIGVDKGSSVYHWCKSFSPSHMIACEILGIRYKELFEEHFPNTSFLWLEESSYEKPAIDKTTQWLNGSTIDILFIDGNKTCFHLDWDAYLPLMSPNGIIFMHDINYNALPLEVFNAKKALYSHWESIIDDTDTKAAIVREQAGIPPSCTHELWLRQWKGQWTGVGAIYLNSLIKK